MSGKIKHLHSTILGLHPWDVWDVIHYTKNILQYVHHFSLISYYMKIEVSSCKSDSDCYDMILKAGLLDDGALEIFDQSSFRKINF